MYSAYQIFGSTRVPSYCLESDPPMLDILLFMLASKIPACPTQDCIINDPSLLKGVI